MDIHKNEKSELSLWAKEEDILNPCGHRNSERIEALKKFPSAICPACLFERIKELEAENDKYKDALVRIDTWAKAYPRDIFLKPDLKKAAKILKAAGMTLDAISADAMRHVLDGVKDIIEQALKGI